MAKVLMMAVSLRKDSFNKKFIGNAHRLASQMGQDAELISFNEYPLPVYDGDIELKGLPPGGVALAAKISAAKALIISTPEYNGSIPAPFKNAIDWVSRSKPMPWAGKHILLLGASSGALGATRGLWHSRQPLDVVGAFVYPEMFGLPKANEAFADDGRLKDAATEERLKTLMVKFFGHIG